MKTSSLAPCIASLLIRVPITLVAVVGSFLAPLATQGQQGYQIQGPYASGGVPANQPLYQQPAYSSPYQQQAFPQTRPVAPKPPKPVYNSNAYDQVRPYSYPAGSTNRPSPAQPQIPNYQYAPKPASNRPVVQQTGNSIAQQVAELKASQRQLDRRIAALEGKGKPADYTPSPPSDKYLKHKVEYGDSLQDLATRYGVTAAQIKSANHLSSNQLSEGQVLKIPVKSGSKNSENIVSSDRNGTHIVQRGETLSKIANKYGISSSALQKANGIRKPDLLVVGQKLVLPGHTGKSHAGDDSGRKTTIASTGKGDAGHYVSKPSKPKPTTLYADAAPSSGAKVGSGAIPAPTGSRGITSYRVEPGDSIQGVARMFGTSTAEIQRKNKLPEAKLPPPGEEIVVPQPGSVPS